MSNRRRTQPAPTTDSIQNFLARVGLGTGNQNDASHYVPNFTSRNRLNIEGAYRSSWIVGMAVDCIAEDMTREGIEIHSSDQPEQLAQLDKEAARIRLWGELCQTLKWARLYGGACAFLMIDGQNPQTPLRIETVAKGQFKGLLPMDRWLLQPSLSDLITDYGPNYGKPKFYQTVPDTMGMPLLTVHHTRMIRMEGVELPYWQMISENGWGQSVLERIWDRLVAFDSTTNGVAQLVYKAHLRTYKVKGLRDMIAGNQIALGKLTETINMIRQFQSNEGLTLMDATDEFETHQYAFSGLPDILVQFGQQISGALGIPLVRLFGQSPTGLNSTGESDLRQYYDGIRQQQIARLGPGVETLYRVLYLSTFGREPPESFEIDFKPLWQMSDEQRAQVTNQTTAAINTVYESNIIDRATALKELKQLSRLTGTFTNITDTEVALAEQDPPPSPESLGLVPPPKPVMPEGAAAVVN